ncbi:uncharacterized protein LOC132722448 [Ruditapes philippinarum]|uniref:uncharacterized protein LOC132722448 n=1 Tax=Ruditapes philippinarum TaxID=129788 RepID=UPI00295B367E|nr:uncharacterized protein LOC132722448 [Ruditapes philippinarum]
MTNVYTRKNHFPRTITLLDYRSMHNIYAKSRRLLSPTRCGNPHPAGLNHQSIPSASTFLIWNPNFARKAQRYPDMMKHTKYVNFTCKHPDKYDVIKTRGKLPDIRYTENTISRISYVNPSRFKDLAPNYNKLPKVVGNPNKKAVTGIVPNLVVKQYLPVIEK